MVLHHLLRGRTARLLGLAGVALLAGLSMAGCSGDRSIVAPETSESEVDPLGEMTEEQRTAASRQSIHVLDRFVEAYNERNVRALALIHHRKYQFRASDTSADMPATMSRRDVLRSAQEMFQADDVLDVQLSMTYGEPRLVREGWRWFVAVDAVVDLEVTMPDVFGPPIVYHVDHHPARFLLLPRWANRSLRWSIVRHQDLYEVPDTERVEVQKTWSEVLHEFLVR